MNLLLAWYDSNRRDLPWRRTTDPYSIWVSEVMLQQTQVATVIPYFERWMKRYPTVESLALAEEQELLSLWQGLGYYRRCRMLLDGARWVAANGMPEKASGWLKVPGVGRYTGSAIASIAFGESVPVVDGNVERVFARFAGSEESGKNLNNAAWLWAETALNRDRPGDWNQALMELGATVCRPKDPGCKSCPLSADCVAFRAGRQLDLPITEKRESVIPIQREAWIHENDGRIGLEQAPAGEWWHGMWRFPFHRRLPGEARYLGDVRHTVTRHRIRMAVYRVACSSQEIGLAWFSVAQLADLAMPSPYRRALELLKSQG